MIVECTRCCSMSAHAISTHIASVIDFSSPDGSRDEHITEYNCSNCLHSFMVTLPTVYSGADIVQNVYDTPQELDFWSHNYRSFTINTSSTGGTGYTNRSSGRGIMNNRRRKTASLDDIKSTTQHTTSTDSCELTEIDLELKDA